MDSSRLSRAALLFSLLLILTPLSLVAGGQTTLPTGSAPPAALAFPWFPDRTHAFVWRNWNVVPTGRIAKVLGTSDANVRDLARSMGLPADEPVSQRFLDRTYITIIRRNWHLLPYEQLLQLLDWTPQHLADTLREDDFLFIKLGNVKPRCNRLTYVAPDEAARRREAEIKQLVETEFGDAMKQPAESRFAFLEQFEKPIPPDQPVTRAPQDGLRFIYSYFAVYGDPLSNPSLNPYPDRLLQQLALRGLNGIWLHVVLRDLAPSPDFPEFGAGHEERLKNLRTLIDRAARFGIRVYLYMNEPRAMPAAFFKNRPDMAGVREGDYVAMCTSNPVVRRWLSDSLEYVFKSVPHLGGVFTITASENLTNCASHHHSDQCVRCREHTPAEILADVNAAIEAGVHRGNPDAKVIVWDWGWPDDQAAAIISHLPKSVWLMSVSEWSLPLDRGGIHTTVGEYSISAVGPGPRATAHWALARKAGLKTVAKIQVNNTWELSSIPAIPALDLVAQHGHNLASAHVDGLMLSWSLGGYPSENLELMARALAHPELSPDQLLKDLAAERFGPAAAPHARAAWKLFSEAFAQYPFNGAVIYQCPAQFGPANLLFAKPTHYHATMIGFPYDDVDGWRGPYPRDVFISQFQKLADGWQKGVAELRLAVDSTTQDFRPHAESDLRLAEAAGLHFRSVVNQCRFILARKAILKAKGSAEQSREALSQMRTILADEATTARALFALTRRDSRIGFEASNQYYYLPQDLVESAINCRYLAGRLKRSSDGVN